MNLGTLQQLVRIALYSVGGVAFGSGVADGELFQQFLSYFVAPLAIVRVPVVIGA